jgi:NAD(P)-dependent dehydrogenase (short-subunit alcohol dehydrogenase family)
MAGPAGKPVVITGVTRGLGRALVDRFAEEGWTVIGCGRSSDAIRKLAKAYPAPHRFSELDVTNAQAVDAWAGAVVAELGPPALLINNAALINASAPLWEVPVEDFSKVIDVNLKGVFHVLRAFLPAMVQARSGIVVNLSSGWGRSTAPEVAPYCATKYGIEGLTQALSQELPKGMATVALNPGIIDTEMLRSCFGGDAGHYPSAEQWSRIAAPFLMQLTARDNGKSLTVPHVPT